MDGDKLVFSIIVPTYNRVESLSECLDALSVDSQSISGDKYEVIVADDGNDEGARTLIAGNYPDVQWLKGPCRGPAANRNYAASKARGSWLIFSDDDCIPDPKWIESYSIAIGNNPAIRVFEGRVYNNQERKYVNQYAPLCEEGGFLLSCNMAIEYELFRKINGFDEKFTHAAMEDVDLRERLIGSGQSFKFVPQASVQHPYREVNWFKVLGKYSESLLLFLKLHQNKSKILYARSHLLTALREIKYEVYPFVLKFRFRGMIAQLYRMIALVLIGCYLCLLHYLPENFGREQRSD